MRKGDKSVRVQLLRWWVRDRKLTVNIDLSKNSMICIGIILLFMSSGYIMNDLMDISIDNYNQKKKTFLI